MLTRSVLKGAAGLAAFAAVVWLEHRIELRRGRSEPKWRRMLRNAGVAGLSGVAAQAVTRPVLMPLAQGVQARQWGVLQRIGLPAPARTAIGIVVLDYAFYWWHVLLHRVPWLWRAHAVHHTDLDMDASTALRFHFTEILASTPFLALPILLGGIGPKAFSVWQAFMAVEVVFHHANLRLPVGLERVLCRIVITPRIHGIHHSIVPEESDSNYSSGLALWDYLHGTTLRNVPQNAVAIGLPAYREPEEVRLPRLVAMPFGEQRDSWTLPDGARPVRERAELPETRLLP